MLNFFFQCIVFVVLFTLCVSGQTGEQRAFQEAMSAAADSAKLALIEKFISDYPDGTLLSNAYAARYGLLIEQKKDSAAFYSLNKYFSSITPQQRISSFNAIAFEFAQRKIYLDTAMRYIDSALSLYGQNEEPVLLNTKAFVLYHRKEYSDAETLQQKAISLLPSEAEFDPRYTMFFAQLGIIQLETSQPLDGMKRLILSNIVNSSRGVAVEKIDSLLTAKNIVSSDVPAFRDSLFRTAIDVYVKRSADSALAKSNIAVSLARNGVLPELAQRFAHEAYTAAQDRTIEERSGAAASVGLVNYLQQRFAEAERYLEEASQYAPPTEMEIFYRLGEVKEKLGKKKEAFTAYLTVAITSRPSGVYAKLLELKNELYPQYSLDSLIVAFQAQSLQFTPEPFVRPKQQLKKNEYERVVLAELFTGSECKPCQAADYAFDYLIERYDASSVAILEYHLHIPLPDPLTNADTEKRSEYYGINSTPTVVIGGNTVITSGGSKFLAKNKFHLYADVIERQMKKSTNVDLQLTASMKNNVVNIKAVAAATKRTSTLRLRIAVVEDEVFYEGANGVKHHKFVVRKMVKSPEGFTFPVNGKLSVSQSVNVASLVNDLKKYSEQAQERYAQLGSGFRQYRYEIDTKRLAIVAFVQDNATREVLQSKLIKIQ